MTRRGIASIAAAFAATVSFATPAAAQSKPGFDCNLFGPTEPCDPYLLYPPGQDLRLTIPSRQRGGAMGEGGLATLQDLFQRLRACWRPPDLADARTGMQLTVRFAFRRDGAILGAPRFTYIERRATPAQRETYQKAVLDSLSRCTPVPFVRGLGNAVAGRPLVIRYIDDRNTQRAGM